MVTYGKSTSGDFRVCAAVISGTSAITCDMDFKDLLNLEVLSSLPGVSAKPRQEVKLADGLDFSRCKPVRLQDGTLSPVKDHVKIGVRALVANPYFALFDEMGGMKTAQTIIAAQFMFMLGMINRVIVVCPASVRPVWFDKDLGELVLHLWDGLPTRVSEFHAKIKQWDAGDWTNTGDQLRWIVTNYEFLGRSKQRVKQLRAYCGVKTLLVLDESSAIKSKTTAQSKACMELRKTCGRVVLLNGTPIPDTPMDLLNQGNTMHPSVLACPYITMYRERYAIMKPNADFPLIVGWKNLEDLQRRFAPYVLRRLKKDCLDLPEKLPPVTLEVKLSPETWAVYKSMRDDMVAWLSQSSASIAGQAVTKAMRLAQITSGFLGGVEDIILEEDFENDGVLPEFMRDETWGQDAAPRQPLQKTTAVREIGREKLDFVLDFLTQHLHDDENFRLLVWSRFKPELARMMRDVMLRARTLNIPSENIAAIEGGQRKSERDAVLRLLNPRTSPTGPLFAGGTYGTGATGHNFTAVHVVVNMSYDYSLFKSLQSADRVHRPGQVHPVSYFDLVAVGPNGQKTVDHDILKARRSKADVATRTASVWLDVLTQE